MKYLHSSLVVAGAIVAMLMAAPQALARAAFGALPTCPGEVAVVEVPDDWPGDYPYIVVPSTIYGGALTAPAAAYDLMSVRPIAIQQIRGMYYGPFSEIMWNNCRGGVKAEFSKTPRLIYIGATVVTDNVFGAAVLIQPYSIEVEKR